MSRLKILHTVAGLWEGTGGPAASVTALCRKLAQRHEVCLLTGEGPLHQDVRALVPLVRVRVERLGPYALAHWSSRFAAACREEAARADIVHDHGVWLHTNWASAAAARRTGRPLVRSPRGMLSPWSLSRSRALKKVLWVLKEARSFREASLVHATSALEETELRVLGLGAPIAVVSNGVDTEGEYAASRVADARSSVDSGARRRILFLSRLHPKKGLDLLQQAWSTLPPNLAVELVIAGHGEAGAISAVEHWTASQAGPPARYVGLLVGDEKVKALASAFLLVLPSRSENYGMAVAEALAAGTPVITTTATPWMDLADRGCGWTIEPTLEALTETLSRALAIEDHTHARMRHHARIFIEDNHSLTVMASQFEALYGTLAERVS